MKIPILFIVFLFSISSFSETIKEISLTGSLRKSQLNEDNFQKTLSITASYAIYLWERTAIEFSYTQGSSTLQSLPTPNDSKVTIESEFKLFGGDFVTTFGERKAPIQPYLKLGIAYLDKKITRVVDVGSSQLEPVTGIVPSAGAGIKIKTSDRFSIKLGADLWASPLGGSEDSLDYTFRFGLSCYF